MGILSLRCLIKHLIGVITLIVVFSHAGLAQSVFEGQVIDSALQEPVSSITVSLLEKKLTTATNSQGYFRINSDETIVNDTLVFSSVGYLTYKVPISTFVNNSVIVLSASNASLAQVEIKRRKLQSKKLINYRPAIGISPIKGSKQNIWGLNLMKQWKPYTYFAPDFTDLAITAIIRQ